MNEDNQDIESNESNQDRKINIINHQEKWTPELEHILIVKSDNAKCMGRLCAVASNYYNRQRSYLLIPASVIAWCLNIFGIVATFTGEEIITPSLTILVASIGNFIVATLTTIAEKAAAGDKVELYNQTSRDYYLIASEISHTLMLHPRLRNSPLQVIADSEKRYSDLMKGSMNLSDRIIDDFFRNIGRDSSGRRLHKKNSLFSNFNFNKNIENDKYEYSDENEIIYIPEHLVKSLIHSGINVNRWYENDLRKELNSESIIQDNVNL